MLLVLPFLLVVSWPLGTWATLLQPHQSFGQRITVPENTKPAEDGGGAPNGIPIQRPFLPFFDLGAPAGPTRADGTFKGRVPEDTLPAGPKDTYTTLDKLQDRAFKLKRPHKKIRGSLGGLDPREVFYADEDLIIIKGGGFQRATYEQPIQEITEGGESIPFSISRNLLSPQEEYNGNIPSFLPPPPASATKYSPLSLFLPSYYFPRSQTSIQYTYAPPPGSFPARGARSPGGLPKRRAPPPGSFPVRSAPQQRRGMGNVIYYCYRGPHRRWHPAYRTRAPTTVDYSSKTGITLPRQRYIQAEVTGDTASPIGLTKANVFPTRQKYPTKTEATPQRGAYTHISRQPIRNKIQLYRPQKIRKPQRIRQQNRPMQFNPIRGEQEPQRISPIPDNYEDLEQLDGAAPYTHSIPDKYEELEQLDGPGDAPYTPRLRTLVGDTRVNFLAPLPPINPDAEVVESTRFKKPLL